MVIAGLHTTIGLSIVILNELCCFEMCTSRDAKFKRSLVCALLQVYKILLQVTAAVQPVSCDEAYLDVTGLGDPQSIAASIRAKIFEETGCTASAGISHNMLLARLATKAGKPDGQHWLLADQARSIAEPLNHNCVFQAILLLTVSKLKHGQKALRVSLLSLVFNGGRGL